ncbi:sulfotransferase 6B1 [Aplysia californica]|uniref:Sulfotransferase 6B1 n=1 Tax=Aplysia californica TaxID=6500 RepID=A0ABM0ZUY3_APLCA|nr:sulfotransferase 6B1 [Aplysia californica]
MSYSNKEILERAREVLKESEDGLFEGVTYFITGTVPDQPRMFHKIKHVELSDSDVILDGYPRSGNHWIFEVVGAILNQDIGNEKDDFLFRLLDFMGDDVESRIHSLPAPRMISSHLWVSRLPEIIQQGNVKIVYILRNPKDALASWYHLLKEIKLPYGFAGTWGEFSELSLSSASRLYPSDFCSMMSLCHLHCGVPKGEDVAIHFYRKRFIICFFASCSKVLECERSTIIIFYCHNHLTYILFSQLVGEIPWGSWFDHVLEMEKFLKEYPDSPVHVIQYEKMKKDPVSEIKKLCDFLGRLNVNVEELALATSFAQMKQNKDPVYRQSEGTFCHKGSLGVMVKGTIGGWCERFTVDQSERYDKAFEEKMKGSKLADMVREYI